METAAPPNPSGTQEECKFKNKLQEFAQRASMHLPVYQTINEGPPHLTKFRSTVVVGGTTTTSPCTFLRRKEAEQHVAKIALENIGTKIRQETMTLIHNETSFCKIILREYATKMKLEFPVYTTSKLEGPLPTFFSSVVFDGKTYGGGLAWNKKVAEQIGARTVIEFLLGQFDTWTTMAEIIKSKDRFFNAINRDISLIVLHANSMPSEVAVDNCPGDIVAFGKDVHGGSIVPHDNAAPLKVPVDGHTSVISSNGEIRHVVSILPVSGAEHFIPPPAEKPKEECICDVLPGSNSGDTIVPTIGQNNQPESLLGKHLDHVCNDSYLEQAVQAKTEFASEGPQTSHFHSTIPTTGGKRSRKKNKKRNNSKKLRMGD